MCVSLPYLYIYVVIYYIYKLCVFLLTLDVTNNGAHVPGLRSHQLPLYAHSYENITLLHSYVLFSTLLWTFGIYTSQGLTIFTIVHHYMIEIGYLTPIILGVTSIYHKACREITVVCNWTFISSELLCRLNKLWDNNYIILVQWLFHTSHHYIISSIQLSQRLSSTSVSPPPFFSQLYISSNRENGS